MSNSSKLLLLFSLFLFVIVSKTGYAQKNLLSDFVIDGTIIGVKDSTIVKLFDIDASKILDSSYTINGKFKLRGSVDKPTSCWLQCLNEYSIIQVENSPMTFYSPLKNMKLESIVTGGKEQSLQTKLDHIQRPYERIYTLAYDSLNNKNYRDSLHRIKLFKIIKKASEAYMNIYVAYGKKHINSHLGLDIVYRNRNKVPKDSILILYNSLPLEMRKNNVALALKLYAVNHTLKKGDVFLDFEVNTIAGIPFKLSSLRGKYIYLTFGSFTCGPCRIENREIRKNYNILSKTVHLVNFSLDVNRKEWEAASKIDDILWYNVSDMEGMVGKIKTLYDVQAMPTSFLIDKNGIIIKRFEGYSPAHFSEIMELASK